MSTNAIYSAILNAVRAGIVNPEARIEHLDIGAGRGELILLLKDAMVVTSHGCDYHPERFEGDSISIKQIDLNHQELPYSDASFHLVTCSEVVEHLENYRALIRQAYRVLKPDGLLILTTPNVLNMKSRVRFMASGFFNLFGPLPMLNDKLYSTNGHISPIPSFYLGHGLNTAGFCDLHFTVDKFQRTSLVWLGLMFPFLLIGWCVFLLRERRLGTLSDLNWPLARTHVGIRLLLGRTLIVSARKKN